MKNKILALNDYDYAKSTINKNQLKVNVYLLGLAKNICQMYIKSHLLKNVKL